MKEYMKITIDGTSVIDQFDTLKDYMDVYCDEGDKIEVEKVKMLEKDFLALPEFDGF